MTTTQTAITDLDRLRTLLDDFGIVHFVDVAPWRSTTRNVPRAGTTRIIINAQKGPKQGGNSGFFVEFGFAPDGAFEKVEVWE